MRIAVVVPVNMAKIEWKGKLKPAGALLACYFLAPAITQWGLGARDAACGGVAFSDILQVCLGGVCLYGLFRLRKPLAGELVVLLGKSGRPPAQAQKLSRKISSSAVFISAAALLLPPLGGMFPASWLITLVKLSVLGYTAYTAYAIWKLSEPFPAYVPFPEPAERPDEPPAASARRCVKCGQRLAASMRVCAFCKSPIQ